VLIPSGKIFYCTSLKTIENYDPSWVLPEPSASKLKKLLKFDVLDEQKSAKKSNKARNPNAQKVMFVCLIHSTSVCSKCRESDFGKLQISRNLTKKKKIRQRFEKVVRTNTNLTILIDEVHHAATGC
jgi:hypothetical protein